MTFWFKDNVAETGQEKDRENLSRVFLFLVVIEPVLTVTIEMKLFLSTS
jgi:hypothetical protein